jgi:hypothetical protein
MLSAFLWISITAKKYVTWIMCSASFALCRKRFRGFTYSFFSSALRGYGGVEGRGEPADVRRFPNAFSSPTFWGAIIIFGGDYN